MPGPAPKHPSTRARRNRSSTAAVLMRPECVEVPDLPKGRPWHEQTLAWWADVWASPMAPEYEESDRHGLFMLAVLVDEFWRKPTWTTAAEIRLQRQCFGLTPIDRRRLQWEIEKVDEAQDRGRKRRAASPPSSTPAVDPRATLRAV